ncbi:MAG TPA: hypothetical protein VGL81_34610 [Polyangiaceae bacterium]|jgi:hypothetical protein
MDVCSRCGKPGHLETACIGSSTMPPATTSVAPATYSLPPLGASVPPGPLGGSGAFSLSGTYGVSQNAVGRALRLLKTQLNLAVGQREEDPERAWLELVSVRERLHDVIHGAKDDPLLLADVERFGARLEEQIDKLTRDVGDEVVAPLYSWVDLLRQRARLDAGIENASTRVAEARASRGAAPRPAATTDDEAGTALAAAEKELAWWRSEIPPLPSPQAQAVWAEAGGDAMRPTLPVDPQVVRSRGGAAQAKLAQLQGRLPGAVPYAGSKLELVLLPTFGAMALLVSMFALASARARGPLGVLSALGWLAFAGVIAVSVLARQRADSERRAAVDAVWHQVLFTEQASALDLEVGWLRALVAALRARRAFDLHKAEGGQLAELASWRPDLEAVVVEVAKSSLVPPG